MDPVEGYERWRRWSARGGEAEVRRALEELDGHLPAGWRRLVGADLVPHQPFVVPGSAWYVRAPRSPVAELTVSLERFAEGLRGGRAWIGTPPFPSGDLSAAWDVVVGFLTDAVVPAAQLAGLSVRMPTREEVFEAELPFDVRERLRAFSQGGRKVLPLSREETGLWHEFVVTAYRLKAVLDPDLFTRWFVADGWPSEAAQELTWRFLDHSLLLARYEDEVSAA